MCTLSWLPRADGYIVWHNRDESTARLPGAPPSVVQRGGLSALAPRDGQAGGTWIGVNELGLTLGIANLYPAEGIAAGGMPPPGLVSRGRIIDDLLGAADSPEAVRQLGAMDLGVFAPFTLAVMDPESLPSLHRWDGGRLASRVVEGTGLLLTSSGAGSAAEERRREAYERHAPGPAPAAELIEALHRSELPELGPDSFCMHRGVAATVSLTRVEVGANTVRMIYTPGPPCRTGPMPALSLRRRAAAGGADGGAP